MLRIDPACDRNRQYGNQSVFDKKMLQATMNRQLTLDKAGRIVLPKPVRDEMELAPGDTLELESFEDQITLPPTRGDAPLRKKRGIWVFRVGEPLTNSVVQKTAKRLLGHRRRT